MANTYHPVGIESESWKARKHKGFSSRARSAALIEEQIWIVMMSLVPTLDHLVIDVHDRMDHAVRTYQALGFQLTERGYHTLGSINHLAIFGTDYIELLGSPDRVSRRGDLAGFPEGLNGLVFKAGNADDVFAALKEAGCAAAPARSFSRPVNVGGQTQDARFRTTHMDASAASFGRVYFCEHLTPELVWRPEWQDHPNGVYAIAQVIVAAKNPDVASASLAHIAAPEALRAGRGGSVILRAGAAEVMFVTPETLAGYGNALPDPAGRADYMAVIVLKTRSCGAARRVLATGGIDFDQQQANRIMVPARSAMNVTLVFAE